MNAALEALRHETRALHEAVEQTATMRATTAHPGDAEAYARYLMALAVSVRPLAEALHGAPPAGAEAFLPDLNAWACLDADLRALGHDVPRGRSAAVPRADVAGWGRLYVVRGAEAGVAVLARQQRTAAGGARLPARFAAALTARRSEWPALCAALGGLSPPAIQRAAIAARDDFGAVLAAILDWEASMPHPMEA